MMGRIGGMAGLFSMDNPVSDAMQIAAEEGPPEEWYEEPYDPSLVVETLHGGCLEEACQWYDSEDFSPFVSGDRDRAEAALRARHSEECKGCEGTVSIGVW